MIYTIKSNFFTRQNIKIGAADIKNNATIKNIDLPVVGQKKWKKMNKLLKKDKFKYIALSFRL